jgi:hypothetical protein
VKAFAAPIGKSPIKMSDSVLFQKVLVSMNEYLAILDELKKEAIKTNCILKSQDLRQTALNIYNIVVQCKNTLLTLDEHLDYDELMIHSRLVRK